MYDYLQQILEMAQAGNWNGIWSLVLILGATLISSVGGIAGVIAIGKVLFGNKKLLAGIFSGVKSFFKELKELVITLFESNKTELIQFYEDKINVLENKFTEFQEQQINESLINQAFINTVLSTPQLMLTFENELKTLTRCNKNEIRETIAELTPEITEPLNAPVSGVNEEVAQVVKKKGKKKIKLKKRG